MGIEFDKLSPAVVLPEGLMCPFNSQNTLFGRDALWAMLIPVTTSFRVCDIWRGYWAQVSFRIGISKPLPAEHSCTAVMYQMTRTLDNQTALPSLPLITLL